VVLTAVTQDSRALKFASRELKAEIERNMSNGGGTAMLQHYINVGIDIVDYSGNQYQI